MSGDITSLSNDELLTLLHQQVTAPKPPIETPAFEREAAQIAGRSPSQSMARDFGTGFAGAFGGAADVLSVPEHVGDWAGGRMVDATGSPALGAATNAGIQAAPAFLGGMLKLGGNAVRGGAEWLMRSAVKPTLKDAMLGKGDRAVKTMLDEGINVSRSGMGKLQNLGSAANDEAATALANSTATIDKNAVASRLGDVERRFQAQVNPQSDLNAIQNADTAFLTHPDLAGQQTMPVQLAQALKQGTYRQLSDKYGELGNATTEAQKALARGLREEIEQAVPEVVAPNARASELWNALNVARRRTAVASNMNPTGLATLAAHPAGGAAFMLDRSSVFKSMMARALNSAQGVPGTVAGAIPTLYGEKARRALMAAQLEGQQQ